MFLEKDTHVLLKVNRVPNYLLVFYKKKQACSLTDRATDKIFVEKMFI